METMVATCEPIFKENNLNLNVQKTVFLTASRTDALWKTAKLLGSLLDFTEDVAARIGAANRAFGSIAWKRHCLDSRLCMFSVLIVPVLLYNCGLWTLTKRQNEQLDVWQRRKLRYIFGVHYPHCKSNQILYEKSKQQPISRVCKRRRLLWFGHVVREGPGTASYGALTMAIDTSKIKRPRGRPRLRWIDVVKSDISPLGHTLEDCLNTARDKKLWLDFIDKCTSV